MSESVPDFRATLQRVLAGDRSAAEQLFAKYRRVVRLMAMGVLRRKMLVRVDESDVAQETMRKALADLRDFQGAAEEEFVEWLRTILRRTAQNLVRDHSAQKRNLDRTLNEAMSSAVSLAEKCVAPDSDGPRQRSSRNELLMQLAWALGELTESERAALEMQHFEGRKVSEIAEVLEKSPAAVTGLLYRGMKKLKRLMAR